MSGSRGEANFVWKCKNCKVSLSLSATRPPDPDPNTEGAFGKHQGRPCHLRAVGPTQDGEPAGARLQRTGVYRIQGRGEYRCFLPSARPNAHVEIQGEFEAKGAESVTKFTAIDLSEGEWFDYDEKAGEEVSITNVKWEIRRA